MATSTTRPYEPPPPPVAPEHHGAAPPTIAAVVLLVVGGLGIFGAIVGYALAPARFTGWDRLSEGSSFGLPSTVVAIVSVLMVVLALVLLGVGIGTARRNRAS